MPVVDASVVVDLVAPDVGLDCAAGRLFRAWAQVRTDLFAPGLLWLEVSNALLTGIRRGRWSGAAADAAMAALDRLPVRRIDTERDVSRAFELARRYDNWPVYDMFYVAVAERAGDEFVTADVKLRNRLAHLGWVKLPAQAYPVAGAGMAGAQVPGAQVSGAGVAGAGLAGAELPGTEAGPQAGLAD